jgi:hypothetical protein
MGVTTKIGKFLTWQNEAWQEMEPRKGGCIEANVLANIYIYIYIFQLFILEFS